MVNRQTEHFVPTESLTYFQNKQRQQFSHRAGGLSHKDKPAEIIFTACGLQDFSFTHIMILCTVSIFKTK